MSRYRTLASTKIGEETTVAEIAINGTLKRRIYDLGIINGAKIKCVGRSALGDPSAYKIFGSVVAIRKNDAEKIFIE